MACRKRRDFSPLSFLPVHLWVPGVPGIFHVIEDPVPHDKEAGDDHVGEQSCAEECSGEDNLGVDHDPHLQISAVTPSAQTSIRVWMASSSKDEIVTCWREKFTI